MKILNSISAKLTKPARNTAKLVVGGVVAAAGSEPLHAAIVVWDETPYSTSAASSSLPIEGYSSSLVVYLQPGFDDPINKTSSPANGQIGGGGGTSRLTTDMNLGDLIGPEASFYATVGASTGTLTTYWGFSLVSSGGTTLYGWLNGTFGGIGTFSASSFALKGYAYDDTGASIKVGATTAVPESSAATMALLAGSAAVWRRRRSRAVTPAA
jgi:hypothetical protein